MRRVMIVSVVLLLQAPLAWAWNAAAHMTIAAAAYETLSPPAREHLDALLQQHPAFAAWRQEYTADLGVPLALYAFMRASTWPDDMRESDPDNPFNHPAWHFVNYPLTPPDFAPGPRPAPDNDVIYALEQAEKALQAQETPAGDRAAWLSWLSHGLGEIHQPEHCVTYLGGVYAQTGDKGGNWVFVQVGARSKPINLHALWDGMAGRFDTPAEALELARELAQDPSLSRGELGEQAAGGAVPFQTWAEQTRDLTAELVYLRGALPSAPPAGWEQGGRAVPPAVAPELPRGYLDRGKAAARRLVMLAAYRLHDRLERLLGR